MRSKANTENSFPRGLIYDLGESILYAEFGELHSKSNNNHIHIEKKVCEVFECLAQSPGNVVTRQQIFDHVWPNMTISDDSLNRCISVLRKKLKEFGHGLSIKTHPKVGFHLECPLTTEFNNQHNQNTAISTTELKIAIDAKSPISSALLVLFATVMLILILSYSIAKQANQQQALPATLFSQKSHHRVVIQPFKIAPLLTPVYGDLHQSIMNLFANHPYHTSVDLETFNVNDKISAISIDVPAATKFVITGSIEQQDQRDILNWRLIDVENGEILLNKSLNLKIASNDINSKLITTDAIAPIGKVLFGDNIEQHVKYIVESANYLFDPHENWQSHQPLITLVAKAIVDIAPNSPIALKALAKFLIKTMWPLRYPNAPYANLATRILEKSVTITPKDIELYQLLTQAYMLQYDWEKSANTVSLALNEFSPSSEEITSLTAEVELNALQVTPKLFIFINNMLQKKPLDTQYSISLAKAHLLTSNHPQSAAIIDSLLVKQPELENLALPFGQVLWQHNASIQGLPLVQKGLQNLTFDSLKLQQLSNEQNEIDIDIDSLIRDQNVLANTIPANQLYLYAAKGDIDKFYTLALKLADTKQFNPEVFISPNAKLLMTDKRFTTLMSKTGLLSYWQQTVMPMFCDTVTEVYC